MFAVTPGSSCFQPRHARMACCNLPLRHRHNPLLAVLQRLAATLGTSVRALLKPVLERTQPAMEKRRLFPLRQVRWTDVPPACFACGKQLCS